MAYSPASISEVPPTHDDSIISVALPSLADNAEEFLRQGNKELSEGYIEGAISNYDKAIELNPHLRRLMLAEAMLTWMEKSTNWQLLTSVKP